MDFKEFVKNQKYLLSEKINLSSLYNKHGKQGFVIISANLSNKDANYNEQMTKNLEQDIKNHQYRYLPVYGGYRGDNGVEDDYEPSFIVFPFHVSGSTNNKNNHWIEDFQELEDFAIEVCDKYGQNSVFVMRPNQAPVYLNGAGEKINSSESKDVVYNDPSQTFFTSLKSKEDVDKEIDMKLMSGFKKEKRLNPKLTFDEYKEKHLTDIKSIGRRFTSDIKFEMYFRPIFNTLNECIRRECTGEVCLHKSDLL